MKTMKTLESYRRILAVSGAALLAAALPIHAQQGTTIGLRGGVSVASASFDTDTFDAENRTGFVGGPFVNFDFGALGFQVAGLFNAKGVETDVGDLEIDYLEFPAVVKLGVPLAVIKPSVFGGAAVAFRTRCELDGAACGDDAFESTDVSAVLGADVAIHLGGVSLWADARYNVGLRDINDAEDVFGDLSNRNWNLTAGIGVQP